MMPNKTYELRNLYFEQYPYSRASVRDSDEQDALVMLPRDWNFKPLYQDIQQLQRAITYQPSPAEATVAQQVFGADLKKHAVGVKHAAHLLAERSSLHQRHLREIDRRHIEAQEKLFGAQINKTPENAKRVLNLEGQLAQLEKERRSEEVAFWKDTVNLSRLRRGLFNLLS